MKKRYVIGGGVASAVLALGLALGPNIGASSADTTTPSVAQLQTAHDQIASANATIQAYIDGQSTPPPTTSAAPTTSTASPTATTDPQLVTAFAAQLGDGTVTLSWAAPANATGLTGYVYGRDGTDTANSGVYTSSLQPTTTAHATLDKLINGTSYNVFVAAVYADGSTTAHRVTVAATPVAPASPTATTSPTPTATATTPVNTNASGLPWSSGVWSDGDPGLEASFISGPRGGAPLDNVLVYADRGTVAQENNPAEWKTEMPSTFNGVTQDLVLGLTTWTSDGAFMTQAQAASIGTSLCSVDGTHPIVREDWEMNLTDGAGANGAELTSSNRTAWQTRFIAVANGIHSTCASAQIDFNPNHGGDQTPGCSGTTCTRAAFQAINTACPTCIQDYGIDSYDSFPAVKSDGSGWNNRLTGSNEMQDALNYAVANGKKFSVPEWGLFCAGTSGCAISNTTDGGNDDPTYIHDMIGFFKTNSSHMAYETYFDESATYIADDLITHNPNSRAQYRVDILANRS